MIQESHAAKPGRGPVGLHVLGVVADHVRRGQRSATLASYTSVT
jgi:hypothetical protein